MIDYTYTCNGDTARCEGERFGGCTYCGTAAAPVPPPPMLTPDQRTILKLRALLGDLLRYLRGEPGDVVPLMRQAEEAMRQMEE